jgi:hypothetical protein
LDNLSCPVSEWTEHQWSACPTVCSASTAWSSEKKKRRIEEEAEKGEVLITQEQKSEEGAEWSRGCGDFGKGLWGWRRNWSDLASMGMLAAAGLFTTAAAPYVVALGSGRVLPDRRVLQGKRRDLSCRRALAPADDEEAEMSDMSNVGLDDVFNLIQQVLFSFVSLSLSLALLLT